jgi:hypothetical protein
MKIAALRINEFRVHVWYPAETKKQKNKRSPRLHRPLRVSR